MDMYIKTEKGNLLLANGDNAKVGMRVLLVAPDPGYSIGPSNPLIGTKWECEGVINGAYGGSIQVQWDNGKHNGYKNFELGIIDSDKYISIWR